MSFETFFRSTHLPSYDLYLKTHFNPLNAELNPSCHLLALLGAHLILHISRIRVNVISPSPSRSLKYLSYKKLFSYGM